MPKSDRLFRLLHLMRTLPSPVTAARLAEETGTSERNLYRDIDTLRASGALIDGEPGYGYRLTEDPALPPQMFNRLEVEALVLGLSQVRQTGDAELGRAAEAAMGKIIATLPERVQQQAAHAVLQVYKMDAPPLVPEILTVLRRSCWDERALDITYKDGKGQVTERRVWPLAIAFLDHQQMLLAWCCLRQGLRKFVLTRMQTATETTESFRPRRVPLLRDYIEQMKREYGA